jgi:hypothetical protein
MIQRTIEDLVNLIGISHQDEIILKNSSSETFKWADEFVEFFYDTLFSYEPTARIFKEGERHKREQTLRDWYFEVTGGEFDEKFWQHQWVVGARHIARKITNAYMLGIMSRAQLLFLDKCMETFEPNHAREVFGAFKRVTDVVAGLIAEGYHASYVEATEDVGTLLRSIIERRLEIEVEKKISRLK